MTDSPSPPPGSSPSGLPPNIVVFGPSANCTLELCPVEATVYGYLPSLAANVVFAVLFGLAVLAHTWLGVRGRAWFFMACVNVGSASALMGYVARVVMHSNPFNFIIFMIQLLGIGIAPVWYCAAIYVTLADTIAHLTPPLSPYQSVSRLPPRAVYWIFIPCDLFSITFQAVGTALSAVNRGVSQTGINLALFGLAFQLLALALFFAFFADYLARYFRSAGRGRRELGWHVQAFLGCLALAALLMVVRAAYRVYELHEGFMGDALKEEAPFIGVEGVVVVITVYSLLIGHPAFAFGRKDSGQRADDTIELSSSGGQKDGNSEHRSS